MIRLLPAAAHRRMPWKNGGGSTTEIAASPAGAGIDAFNWRVSMAEITRDGPFSRFGGIERTLTILEGNGIRLDLAGETVELTRQSPPFSFAGDVDAGAALIDGPVTDLNVMTRRGALAHRVTRLTAPIHVAPGRLVLFLNCGQSPAEIAIGGAVFRLDKRDALLIDGELDPAEVRPGMGAVVFQIEI